MFAHLAKGIRQQQEELPASDYAGNIYASMWAEKLEQLVVCIQREATSIRTECAQALAALAIQHQQAQLLVGSYAEASSKMMNSWGGKLQLGQQLSQLR